MQGHIQVGREYPGVDNHTTYSFGLDDQEFVVAFDTDDVGTFLDLVQRAAQHRGLPLHGPRHAELHVHRDVAPAALNALDGEPVALAAALLDAVGRAWPGRDRRARRRRGAGPGGQGAGTRGGEGRGGGAPRGARAHLRRRRPGAGGADRRGRALPTHRRGARTAMTTTAPWCARSPASSSRCSPPGRSMAGSPPASATARPRPGRSSTTTPKSCAPQPGSRGRRRPTCVRWQSTCSPGSSSSSAWTSSPTRRCSAELVAVKGIGLWTAQMFLMFQLERPDVLPTGDLGIRKRSSAPTACPSCRSRRRWRRSASRGAPTGRLPAAICGARCTTSRPERAAGAARRASRRGGRPCS